MPLESGLHFNQAFIRVLRRHTRGIIRHDLRDPAERRQLAYFGEAKGGNSALSLRRWLRKNGLVLSPPWNRLNWRSRSGTYRLLSVANLSRQCENTRPLPPPIFSSFSCRHRIICYGHSIDSVWLPLQCPTHRPVKCVRNHPLYGEASMSTRVLHLCCRPKYPLRCDTEFPLVA